MDISKGMDSDEMSRSWLRQILRDPYMVADSYACVAHTRGGADGFVSRPVVTRDTVSVTF